MKMIKTGIVGLGRLGILHARDLRERIPEAELVAACSVVPSELEALNDWGIALFDDYDEMLNHKGLEAVVIVSSSALHHSHIIKALNARKHVFSEKPMGLNLKECEEIESLVNSKPDLVFQLGFMRRYDPSYSEAKRIIANGEIGIPVMVKATSQDPVSDIQGFIDFAPTSGGEFLDMAVHDIDLALWYLDDQVDTIYAVGNSYIAPEVLKYGECDNAFAIMKFKNGAMAFLHPGRTASNGCQVETEIIGTKGALRIDTVPRKNRIQVYRSEGVIEKCVKNFKERFREAFILEKIDFFECIAYGKKPRCSASDGTASTRVAYAANEAYTTGKIIKVKY